MIEQMKPGGPQAPKNPKDIQREWENLKNLIHEKPQDTTYAIRTARQLGVDDAEIKAVAQKAVDRENRYNNAPMAFAIMKAAELGTPEERAEWVNVRIKTT